MASLLYAERGFLMQVTEKTSSPSGAENRHPVYSKPTPAAYSPPRTILTGTLAFDSPPLVSGLHSYPGTLSHFSFQPGSGEYSPGMLTFDGSARDAGVRIANIMPRTDPSERDANHACITRCHSY